MAKYLFSLFIALCFFSLQGFCAVNDGGFGTQYTWFTLEDGLALAKKEGKPLMLIIHKSWCGACKALKPQFSSSLEIESLSRHFVMVNTEDDAEPKDKKYAPDGSYVPRIYFLDSYGNVQDNIINENGNKNYKYYYFDAAGIVASMKKAAELMPNVSNNEHKEL